MRNQATPVRSVLRTVSVLALWVGGTVVAWAQEPEATVTWTTSDAGASVVDEAPAGYVTLALDNDVEAPHTLTLFRLREGATREQFEEANAAIDRAFGGEGDPAAAIEEGLALVDVVGEVTADPGGRAEVGIVLEPGEYVLDAAAQAEGPPERAYRSLTVTAAEGAPAPEADVTIRMVDFAFALPPEIGPGEQVWHVVNQGQQLHHLVLFRLNEDTDMDDLMAWMETEEGPPPGEEAGYVGILSHGYGVYQTMDIAPGEYVAICFMPDHRGEATGMPHVALGMIQGFTVPAE